MSPLVIFPGKTIRLPSRLFGSVRYYALMSAFGTVVIDDAAKFNKREKEVHRFTVADTHGIINLTVPISHRHAETNESESAESKLTKHSRGRLNWCDINISDHDCWWTSLAETLASAYGRTPFFEFYIGRFRRFFDEMTVSSFHTITCLNKASDAQIRDVLSMDNKVIYTSDLNTAKNDFSACDYRQPDDVVYYQVREQHYGFIPDLSILDLIFNMGPESPLVLREMTKHLI